MLLMDKAIPCAIYRVYDTMRELPRINELALFTFVGIKHTLSIKFNYQLGDNYCVIYLDDELVDKLDINQDNLRDSVYYSSITTDFMQFYSEIESSFNKYSLDFNRGHLEILPELGLLADIRKAAYQVSCLGINPSNVATMFELYNFFKKNSFADLFALLDIDTSLHATPCKDINTGTGKYIVDLFHYKYKNLSEEHVFAEQRYCFLGIEIDDNKAPISIIYSHLRGGELSQPLRFPISYLFLDGDSDANLVYGISFRSSDWKLLTSLPLQICLSGKFLKVVGYNKVPLWQHGRPLTTYLRLLTSSGTPLIQFSPIKSQHVDFEIIGTPRTLSISNADLIAKLSNNQIVATNFKVVRNKLVMLGNTSLKVPVTVPDCFTKDNYTSQYRYSIPSGQDFFVYKQTSLRSKINWDKTSDCTINIYSAALEACDLEISRSWSSSNSLDHSVVLTINFDINCNPAAWKSFSISVGTLDSVNTQILVIINNMPYIPDVSISADVVIVNANFGIKDFRNMSLLSNSFMKLNLKEDT